MRENAVPLFHVCRPHLKIIVVGGFNRRCSVQLEALQSGHDVLNLSLLLVHFLPQLKDKQSWAIRR